MALALYGRHRICRIGTQCRKEDTEGHGCPGRATPALSMIVSRSEPYRPPEAASWPTIRSASTPFRLHPLKGVGGTEAAERRGRPLPALTHRAAPLSGRTASRQYGVSDP